MRPNLIHRFFLYTSLFFVMFGLIYRLLPEDKKIADLRQPAVLSETDPSPTTQTSTCTQPSGGCGVNYYWNTSECQCKPQAGTCVPPYNGCPTGTTFNTSTCECVNSTSCNPPSAGCGQNYYWNSVLCQCKPNPTPVPTTCSQPAAGCPYGYTWNSGECRCVTSNSGSDGSDSGTSSSGSGGSGSSSSPTPTFATTNQYCPSPVSGCGTNRYWDTYSCNCRDYQYSETTACSTPGSGCPDNYFWDSGVCSCRPIQTTSVCSQPTTGCGTGWYWSQEWCSCRSTSDENTYYQSLTSSPTQSAYDRLAYEPPERLVCVKSLLTDDEFQKLRYFVPTDSQGQNQIYTLGEKAKSCWGNYQTSGSGNASVVSTYTSPLQAEACLISTLGKSAYEDVHSGKRQPTYEEHLKFERCYGRVNEDSVNYLTAGQKIPPPVSSCLKNTLGDEYSKIKSGQSSVQPELRSKIDACFGVDPQPFRQATTVKLPGSVKSCLAEKIGANRFAELESSKAIPSVTEKESANLCFKELNQEQAPFIPLPPEQMIFLDTDDESIKLTQALQEKTISGNKQLGGKIVLSGIGLPNSVVTIYIFSEPIVVTTKTDENGDWVYELNQPLSGDKHLAYASVRNSSGKNVKSSVIDFTVVAAEDDLALRFIDENQTTDPARNSFFGYAVIFMSLAILVVGLFYVFYFQKNLKKSDAGNLDSGGNSEREAGPGSVN